MSDLQTFDFTLSKFKFRIINVGKIKLGHLINFQTYAEKFSGAYVLTHLDKLLDKIIIKGVSVTNFNGNSKYTHLDIPVLQRQQKYNDYENQEELKQLINELYPGEEILLLYMYDYSIDQEINLNLKTMYKLESTDVKNKFEIMEQKIKSLEFGIIIPKQKENLESEEKQYRKIIMQEMGDESGEISKYYSEIQYFESEQRRRGELRREQIKQQWLSELNEPSAPPAE
jgi:hypothetical protein